MIAWAERSSATEPAQETKPETEDRNSTARGQRVNEERKAGCVDILWKSLREKRKRGLFLECNRVTK